MSKLKNVSHPLMEDSEMLSAFREDYPFIDPHKDYDITSLSESEDLYRMLSYINGYKAALKRVKEVK